MKKLLPLARRSPLFLGRRWLLFIALSSSFIVANAQNLVPNWSFEEYDSCPDNTDCNITDAIGWSCYGDCTIYYNACAPYSPYNYNGVPYNAGGFQYAATGNAYVGAYFYYPMPGYGRDYFGTVLTSPLIIGTKYYVTFKVSLSSINSAGGYTTAVNKMGALFSTIPFTNCQPTPAPPNRAQIYTNTIITDTLNWTTIQGSFIADSTYKYINIGNFFSDSATSKFYFLSPAQRYDSASYYFVDDVCVSTDSMFCADLASINEVNSFNPDCVKVFPNPFTIQTTLSISCPENAPFSLMIYNTLGQVIRKIDNVKNNNILIRKDNLPSGMYFYSLRNESGIIKNDKLIIESPN